MSNKINTRLFTWKDYKLYYGNKYTGTKLIPTMFKIHTSKGDAVDIYNLSRSKQHAKDLTIEDMMLEQT